MLKKTVFVARKHNKTNFQNYVVFFYFDNTITPYDILDDMLPRFSRNDRWIELEEKWKKGLIGSRACLEAQIKELRVKRKDLDRYLAQIRIDPYFKKLIDLLRNHKVKAVVLSDSFDYILNFILRSNTVSKLEVYCNKLRLLKNRLIPDFPFSDKKCQTCAHCKAKNILATTDKDSIIIYVGDGHSDICPAKYANIVFAKEELLRHFRDNKLACLPYKSLKEVYIYIKRRFNGRKTNY
jgi:2,3-diketo-5-methylthio-1-phosphopentane phosphatase